MPCIGIRYPLQAMMYICSGPNFTYSTLKDHCPKGFSIPCWGMTWHDMVFTWSQYLSIQGLCFFNTVLLFIEIVNKLRESTLLVGISIDSVTHFRHLDTKYCRISHNMALIWPKHGPYMIQIIGYWMVFFCFACVTLQWKFEPFQTCRINDIVKIAKTWS